MALQIPEKAIDGAAPGDVVTTDLVIALKGTGRHFIASYRGDFDDDGRLIGYFVIHQEVSELKELANKLTASETRARLVMDHVPVEIAHLDAELRVDLANHRLCRLLEVELDQIVGKTITEVFGRRFHTNNATAINDALKGIPSHFEQVLDPRSGRIYDMTYTPDIDQFGRIIGVYAMSYEITALKKAQSSLATSERRLRSITDNLPALITYVDKDEHYQFANAYVGKMFGTDDQQLIGKSMSEARGREAYSRIHRYVQQALDGEVVRFEGTELVRGVEKHYQSDYVPDFDEGGAVIGFYSMTFDITERKTAEIALASERERIKLITDNVPAVISYVDLDHRFRFVNETHRTWFERSPESLLGTRLDELRGAEDGLPEDPSVKAFRGERVVYIRKVSLPNSERYIRFTAIPDFDPENHVRGVYFLGADISELKMAEETLRAGEERLRTITDNLPALICYIDRHYIFQFNNRMYERWLERPVSEITGRPVRDVYGEEVFKRLRPSIAAALAGEHTRFEVEFDGKTGLRYARGVYVPDFADGQVRGVYGLVRDVTKVKEAEVKLRKLAEVDSLTGLANRSQFNAKLEDAMSSDGNTSTRLALLFLDVDKFKLVNDELGHKAGDDLLIEFGRRVRQCVRPSDLVARLNGDEFVVLLTGLDKPESANIVAQKILNSMQDAFSFAGNHRRVTTSIEIAVRREVEFNTQTLMARADEALYAAKAAGRETARALA